MEYIGNFTLKNVRNYTIKIIYIYTRSLSFTLILSLLFSFFLSLSLSHTYTHTHTNILSLAIILRIKVLRYFNWHSITRTDAISAARFPPQRYSQSSGKAIFFYSDVNIKVRDPRWDAREKDWKDVDTITIILHVVSRRNVTRKITHGMYFGIHRYIPWNERLSNAIYTIFTKFTFA